MPTDLDTLIALLILGLGTARLSALVVLDDITEGLRDMLFHYFPPEDNDARGWYYQGMRKATPQEREKLAKMKGRVHWWQLRFWYDSDDLRRPHFIGRLVSCHKCVSVWVGAANAVAYLLAPGFTVGFNFALALSFLSIIFIGRYWR